MKLRDVGLCLIGGTVLYVSMAACAPRPGGAPSTGRGGSSAGGGHGGTVGGGGSLASSSGGQSGAGGSAIPDSGIADVLTDPVPTASADPGPGSRLKPKYRLGDDGAREYLSGQWWDSQRAEDCAFVLAGDGATRCLPPGVDFRYYADAQCTKPMAMMQGTCGAPKYATSTTAATCGLDPAGLHVYALGGAITPPQIYAKGGSSCYAVGQADATWQYYAVGAEVPASSFVAATIAHD